MNILIIILIIFIIIILYLIFNKNIKTDKFNNDVPIHVGNVMSDYFYNLGLAIIKKKNFSFHKYNYTFFKDLPNEIKANEYNKIINIDIYKSLIDNGINSSNFPGSYDGFGMWECNNIMKEKYWKCMKPLVHKILDDTFIKSELVKKVDCPIIHFRCADTPFVKHQAYHFQKYKFFKDALDEIKTTINFNKVIILYNNTHLSNEKNMSACDKYMNELQKYIINLGYNVIIKSNDNMDDFAIMFYAPAVISTYSSFSFMSGFFGLGKFISAGHYNENNNSNEYKKVGDWLYKGYDLNHKDVKDYYDTTTVINQLKI